MPSKANGEAIEARIQAMKLRQPGLNYSGVCDLTDELGPGYVSVDLRTLNRARKGENIQDVNLKALAAVLGMEMEEIVVSPSSETIPKEGYSGNGGVTQTGQANDDGIMINSYKSTNNINRR